MIAVQSSIQSTLQTLVRLTEERKRKLRGRTNLVERESADATRLDSVPLTRNAASFRTRCCRAQ